VPYILANPHKNNQFHSRATYNNTHPLTGSYCAGSVRGNRRVERINNQGSSCGSLTTASLCDSNGWHACVCVLWSDFYWQIITKF